MSKQLKKCEPERESMISSKRGMGKFCLIVILLSFLKSITGLYSGGSVLGFFINISGNDQGDWLSVIIPLSSIACISFLRMFNVLGLHL